MGQPFTVTGSLRRVDHDRVEGLRVVAFDRDIPSIERMRGPQHLGEALVDAEGRFRIELDTDHFIDGKGAREQPRPDLSFRVFTESRRELTILELVAEGAQVSPDHIVFNAASPAQVVMRLHDSDAQQEGLSEYDGMVALLTPAAEPVTLAELTDADLEFLAREFDWTAESPEPRRTALVRAASLLRDETGVPAAAFYGWARTTVPELWSELPPFAAADIRDAFLRRLLAELIALDDERLAEALRRAAHDLFIASEFAERAGAVVDLLKRRIRTAVAVTVALVSELDSAPLPGYQVSVRDAHQRLLADDITDIRGLLDVSYFVAPDEAAEEHLLQLSVTGPALADAVSAEVRVPPPRESRQDVTAAVRLPASGPTLQQLINDQQLALSPEALTVLDEAGVRSFADIRRRGGAQTLLDIAQLDAGEIHALHARTEMDRITADPVEATALAEHFDSVIAIADTTRAAFVAATDGMPAQRALELHTAARAQAQLLDLLLSGQAVDVVNGMGQ